MGIKRDYDIIEQLEGLSATSLQQQVQDSQEAYFDIERELEACVLLMQEAVELHEDEEDISHVISRMALLIEEHNI